MTSMIVSAPPAPVIRTRRALVFLDRDGRQAAGGADRRLVHALAARGYAVETAECDAGDHRLVGAFLDAVEPGDLLLVRWSTESGWGRREFGALMAEFARRVERSDGAALVLVVDFGWLVTAGPGRAHETVSRLRVRGEPVAAAAALTTSATVPGERPVRAASLTAILAEGILSGEADLDRDGTVSVGDLHRYAEERCAELGDDRRPCLLTYGEGELIGVASARASAPDLGAAFGPALARLAVAGDAVPAVSAAELVSRIYDVHLGEDARELLRRAALLAEDEPLTPELAALLCEGTPSGAALGELAEWGLLGRNTPFADPAVRRAVAGRLEPEELAQVSAMLRLRRAARRAVRPRARLTGDRWTIDDRLGHRVYAEAIAAFVRHPDTRPPLTIGVKGPWGAGKTSLMRMVQDLLDPGAASDRPAGIHLNRAPGRGTAPDAAARAWPRGPDGVTNAEVLPRTGGPDAADRGWPPHRRRGPGGVTNAEVLARVGAPRDGGVEHAVPGELPLRPADWRPTVWFNPWMYQSGEQVWAGLAHEIISQVTCRLPRGERERFWLTLNLSRIDRDAVRRRAYRLAATRLLPVALALGATALSTVAALAASVLVPAFGPALRGTAAAVGSGGTLVVLVAAAVRLTRFLSESADATFRRLVRQPDLLGPVPESAGELVPDPGYRSRTGFLHLVQTDMRRVLDMVASAERPLVVFVDDLDRCSPGTVAQVIEAVNLFLAGEFPNCVFVLAMEPEVVAAHVEVAYRDLAGSLPAGAEERSGLGWRFLEKIVQLPLSVPAPDDGARVAAYLRTLLGVPAEPYGAGGGERGEGAGAGGPSGTARPDPELVDRIETAIRRLGPTARDLDAAARQAQDALGPGPYRGREPTAPDAPGRGPRWEPGGLDDAIGGLSAAARLAADRVHDDLYSDQKAYTAIERALPALTPSNPRELKRYVNVFRFYSFVTYRRALAGAPGASDEEVAKLAVLTVRWPHLLSLLARDSGGPVLDRLERAAPASGPDEWPRVLAEVGLPPGAAEGAAGTGRWDALRALLAAGPPIAHLARDLL
ncbi:KAP family NTPase [Sphaerisporangium corydalis]|uniref:KAP family NTPase n=1 Tax=Sphaerisporangium corydalis TaxID=1441875 RepID=A0ABV9EJM2_9ACTN|nr:KAP family NTPase [Sphaerisporangium corydalis]